MRKIATITLLLLPAFCFSQDNRQYANFIQTDTAVKWAAVCNSYIDLTPANPNFNIRNFYSNKLKQQQAKAYIEDSTSFSVKPITLGYSAYTSTIRPVHFSNEKVNWNYKFEEHSIREHLFNTESNSCDTCTLNNKLSLFKVKQLLYYKNHHLRLQNILLTPVIYTKKESEFKSDATYYETAAFAFNDANTDNTFIPAAAKFIARAGNIISLSFDSTKGNSNVQVLTLGNWNIIYPIYKDIKKNIVKAYNTETSLYPSVKNIIDYRKIDEYMNPPLEVPVYDNDGNMSKTIKVRPELNFDLVKDYLLIQDLYFDFEKERLYSKIIAFIPQMNIVTSTGISLGLADYWGIIFPKEKQ